MRINHRAPLVTLIASFLLLTASAQQDLTSTKSQASEAFDKGRLLEAAPLYEELLAADPQNIVYLERLGFSLLSVALTEADPEKRKAIRVRARKLLLQSHELGNTADLWTVGLDLPEDGSETPFSNNKQVEQAMNAAEAAFGRGELDEAVTLYRKVLALDPKQYFAATFIGDVYFKQKKYDLAGEWFKRAIEIDRNIETAHRYWGDALLAQGQVDNARERFIEAVIADPYGRSWVGLKNWATTKRFTLRRPFIEVPLKEEVKDGKTNISLNVSPDPDGGAMAWIAIAGTNARYRNGEFGKQFPNEGQYRKTLLEAAEGFHSVAKIVEELNTSRVKEKKQPLKLDGSLDMLIQLHRADLIEPYILFFATDSEISRDYADYRDKNRAKLKEFLIKYVIELSERDAASATAKQTN
jgi:tetratricopeptide (TPR) repeat protein